MAFTKGEWKIHKIVSDYAVYVDAAHEYTGKLEEKRIAQVGIDIHDNAEANANLIAAAPDLYEALKKAGKVLFILATLERGEAKEAIEKAMFATTAALAKAEGK